MVKRTVRKAGYREVIIKKSRFIAHVLPVTTEEDALAFIEKIRKEHATATHNVYAYIVTEPQRTQRFSDDGEPSGTAGRPIMELITELELVDLVVVVTRYFGGILLGAGGLVRAYRQSALEGIKEAGMDLQVPCSIFRSVVNYGHWGKVQNLLAEYPVRVLDTTYGAAVELRLAVSAESAAAVTKKLLDVTNGEIQLEEEDMTYLFMEELRPRE